MRKAFLVLGAAVILSLVGCSESETSDVQSSLPATEAASKAEVSSAVDTGSEQEKILSVKAEIKSYKDEILCFEYEGKEYSLPMKKDKFDNEHPINDRNMPSLSEMIINNKLGEKITAMIALNEDMTQINKCDVVTPNGKIYVGTDLYDRNNKVIREKVYTMTRKGGSKCEFSNSEESFECDLNDLPPAWKLDYPETVYPVLFSTYRFKDGRHILFDLVFNVEITNDRVGGDTDLDTLNMYGKRTGFFAVIQSLSDDTVTVILNDGKTLCTVPTYYNDGGELAPGGKIMVILPDDGSLFGKGGEHSFDYAVIITYQEYFKNWNDKFEDIAYGAYVTNWDSFDYTRTDEI